MSHSTHRALLVSNEHDWRQQVLPKLLIPDWDVYFVTSANEGRDLLKKKKFDLIVVDDSLQDMDAPEFCFAVADLASNHPIVLVASEETDRFQRVWDACEIHLAGSRDTIENELLAAVRKIDNAKKN